MKKSAIFLPFLLLFNCGTPVPESQDEALALFRVAMRRPPDSFNPYISQTFEAEIVAARMFPTLFHEGTSFENGVPALKGSLVKEYTLSDDGLVLDLMLNPGLFWSDGKPLTAHDVDYSFQVQKDKQIAWVSSDRKQRIAKWEVIDDHQLKVFFSEKNAFNLLDVNEGFIIPKHHFSQFPTTDWQRDWGKDLVVFGPWKIGSHVEGEQLVLESLDSNVPDVGFAFVRDKETQFQLITKGELDFTWSLPIERLPEIRDQMDEVIFDDLNYAFLGWSPIDPEAIEEQNLADPKVAAEMKAQSPHPLFGDVRVRTAMSYGINRQAHTERLWHGVSRVPATPWQAGLPYAGLNAKPLPFDPAKAEALLDEAGWIRVNDGLRTKDGKEARFTIVCNVNKGLIESYLLAVKQDLLKIGIHMDIDFQERSRYFQTCMSRKFDAMFGMFKTGTRPDLAGIYQSTSPYNFTTWHTADEALKNIQDAGDPQALETALSAIENQFLADQPITLIYQFYVVGGRTNKDLKVKGNYIDPLNELETWGHGN